MNAFLPHRAAVIACLLAAPCSSPGQVPDQLKQSIFGPASSQSGAELGFSVAVDGGYTVVGAPFDDFGARDSGVVKVFDTSTGALLFVLTNPSPGQSDFFGRAVAISGARIVIGAPYDKSPAATPAGSAYIYDLSSGTPTVPILTLNNPNSGSYNGSFGRAVAIWGTRVVVGAPYDGDYTGFAYVYDIASATPTVPVETLTRPSPLTGD
jgi:hypothetical protein